MRKVIITESSLRGLLREMMDSPIKVNPVVDPQAAEVDPTNLDFVPTNKIELMSALRTLVSPVEDDKASQVYVALKDALEKEEDEMKKDVTVETIIRNAIRKILKENKEIFNEYWEKDPNTKELVWKGKGPAPTLSKGVDVKKAVKDTQGSSIPSFGPGDPNWEKQMADQREKYQTLFDEPTKGSSDAPAPGRKRKNFMMTDVGGASLRELADMFGFKNENGALQWINKVQLKFKLRFENFDIVMELVREALNEWVNKKIKEGKFTKEQVEEWYDPANARTLLNPILNVIQDDTTFREMLSPKIDKALKMKLLQSVED